MDNIVAPWPWYVAGPLIALVMFSLLYFGKSFGVSSNLRTICAIGGGSVISEFFDYEWKSQYWNLVFVLGTVIGGYIASNYLTNPEVMSLSSSTLAELDNLGIDHPTSNYLPNTIFSFEVMGTLRGFVILIVGGFLVGFGARYAGGCTSGHAISGLSNLQVPSLVAVVGFFIGGLTMVHLLLPIIFS